jgi:hypothetical protein
MPWELDGQMQLEELRLALGEEAATKEQDEAFNAVLLQLFEEFPAGDAAHIPAQRVKAYRESALGLGPHYVKAFIACDTGVPNERIIAAAMLIYT